MPPIEDEFEELGLSEEELAALREDDDEESEDDDERDDGEPEGEVRGDEGSLEEGGSESEDAGDEQPDVDASDGSEDGGEDQEQVSDEELLAEFQPQYKFEGVSDYDDQMKSISEAKSELYTKYMDGELDFAEYQQENDKIQEQVFHLREAQLKAQMATEQNRQAAEQRWQWEQDRFFGQASNKVYLQDPLVGSAFDRAVKDLANDPSNAKRPMNWFLEEADRQVKARFRGSDEGAPAAKPQGRKAAKRGQIPPNLGDLPSAEQPDTSSASEFSHLDKLSGMELEAALARLTPEQEARYLKG